MMTKIATKMNIPFITHGKGQSAAAINRYMGNNSDEETGKIITNNDEDNNYQLLITTSAWEGLSFDDDLARICLIPKLPFPFMGDPLVLKKKALYPDFITNEVLIAIQQAHGRIQRNNDDWGITVCFDSNIHWLMKKGSSSLERWFADRLLFLTTDEALSLTKRLIKDNQ